MGPSFGKALRTGISPTSCQTAGRPRGAVDFTSPFEKSQASQNRGLHRPAHWETRSLVTVARKGVLIVSTKGVSGALMPESYDGVLKAYKDVALLKKGGQKSVYVATDPKHGRVVIKVGRYPSANSLERIRREVEVLRELDSSYYPRNIDFRLEAPDLFVIVEEYVDSRPLSSCLSEFTDPRIALTLLRQLVLGLNVIWSKRIVHRDVKPDNILVLDDRTPKIIDLGIARLLDKESLTRTVNARGPCTPAYASPEQLKNRKAHIDPRTDQFALGIVFVQLLLGGAHPFDPNIIGSGDSIVANILNGTWDRAKFRRKDFPPPIYALASRLLGAEPFNRYRTVDELLQTIGDCEATLK